MALEDLFAELITTRSRYEDLRIAGGDFGERAQLQTQLHALRARIAAERNTVI